MKTELKNIATRLVPASVRIGLDVEILDISGINYEYSSDKLEGHYDNTVVAIKMKHRCIEDPFWLTLFDGAQRRETDVRFVAAFKKCPTTTECPLYEIDAIKAADLGKGAESLRELIDAFDYKYFTYDEASEGEPVYYDDPMFLCDIADEIKTIRTLAVNMEFDRENPSRKELQKLKEKVEEIEDLLADATKQNNVASVLESPLTPLSVKKFLRDNKITAIEIERVKISSDYMPIEGNVIAFESEAKNLEKIVYEIDDGFLDMYGEGICSYEEYAEIEEIDITVAEALFNLFDETFNRYGEFQARKITMNRLEKDENVLKNIYSTCSEVSEGEFADFLYNNMDEVFAQPHNIALITKAIQDFRSWGAVEDEDEIQTEINYVQDVKITDIQWDSNSKDLPDSLDINIPLSIFKEEPKEDYDEVASQYMSDLISDHTGFCHTGFSDTFNKNSFFINEYHDYMYADGKFVEAGVRVGTIRDKELILDKGIFYAYTPRNEYL